VGYIGTAGYIGMALGSYLAGWMADQWGRVRIFVIMIAIFAICTGLTALCATAGLVMASRALAGFGLGGMIPVGNVVVAEAVPSRSRGAMLGWAVLSAGIGAVMASILGKMLIPELGWRLMFVLGGVPIIIVFVNKWIPESPRWFCGKGRDADAAKSLASYHVTKAVIAQAVEETKNEPVMAQQNKPKIRDLFAPGMRVRVAYNWLVYMIVQFVQIGFGTFVVVIFINNYHLKSSHALTYMVYLAFSMLAGRLITIPMLDRLGRKITLIIGYLGGCLAPILLIVNHSEPILIASVVLLGIISGPMIGAAVAISTELYPLHIRGLGASTAMGAGRLAGAASPAIIGWILADGGNVNWVWIMLSAVSLAGVVLTIIMGTETRGRTLEELGQSKAGASM
jgi:putative MFS transporter